MLWNFLELTASFSVISFRMTGWEFFTRFPTLYPFLLSQLEEAASSVDRYVQCVCAVFVLMQALFFFAPSLKSRRKKRPRDQQLVVFFHLPLLFSQGLFNLSSFTHLYRASLVLLNTDGLLPTSDGFDKKAACGSRGHFGSRPPSGFASPALKSRRTLICNPTISFQDERFPNSRCKTRPRVEVFVIWTYSLSGSCRMHDDTFSRSRLSRLSPSKPGALNHIFI